MIPQSDHHGDGLLFSRNNHRVQQRFYDEQQCDQCHGIVVPIMTDKEWENLDGHKCTIPRELVVGEAYQ